MNSRIRVQTKRKKKKKKSECLTFSQFLGNQISNPLSSFHFSLVYAFFYSFSFLFLSFFLFSVSIKGLVLVVINVDS